MSACTPPADLFGPLFGCVQEAALFADSKCFADAVPRRAPALIRADWNAAPPATPAAIRAFVRANFDLPQPDEAPPPDGQALAPHIRALWPALTRSATAPLAGGSELWLPNPYVVPGGRFRELYYWDSYFTMLGLARSGQQPLVEGMIANFGSLLDRVGHIPNGTRSYYLSRSHPPVFHLMAQLSQRRGDADRRQRLGWMLAEHGFWMQGAETLAPGDAHRRVVRLADGAILNRYWDDRPMPRDESWREDVLLAAAASGRAKEELWRDVRAAAESGWDFSSRWLADGRTLATIRTTRLLPVDLNALLHGLEQTIASEALALGQSHTAHQFRQRVDARKSAISAHLWHEPGGYFCDHDLDSRRPAGLLTGAAAFPLFAGLASGAQARRTASALRQLLRPGGLTATGAASGQQWDAPNGWAPLQWIAISGLRRYGEPALAGDIAGRWLRMVEANYARTGRLFEKYDVESGTAGSGGEYAGQTGFGWTNGVTLELLAEREGNAA